MAESAVAEAPVIVPAAPVPPPPKPTSEISVNVESVDKGPKAPPPKPGSVRADMFKSLRKKVGAPVEDEESPAQVGAKPEKAQTPVEQKEPRSKKPEAPPSDDEQMSLEAETAKAEPGKQGKEKPNPWKLMEQYKSKSSQLEKELAEIKSKEIPEKEREDLRAAMKKFEERNKELEDEIRYVNYEKSSEFKEKYQQPYEKAWEVAIAELSEIPVTDPQNGNVRAADSNDLWELVNMSLGPARARANEVFGDFADDVMAHRKEIKKLLETRAMALKEAKTNGAKREETQLKERQMAESASTTVIKETWDKWDKHAQNHEKWGKYFVPVDGDQEGNSRLAKGYQLVDRAFSDDIRNPNLNSDQRSQAIQRLVAVRNRAAAFSRLVYQNDQLQSKLDAMSKELEEFKKSTPDTAGSQQPDGSRPGLRSSAQDAVFAALRKYAK